MWADIRPVIVVIGDDPIFLTVGDKKLYFADQVDRAHRADAVYIQQLKETIKVQEKALYESKPPYQSWP
jgi:hypothetical protein